MRILAIETSCDETAAAIILANPGDKKVKLVSETISSSLKLHAATGGIIPEVAARKQIEYILPVIKQTLLEANLYEQAPDIDAIAVTYGPGLIGSLLIGVETAKTLSYIWNKPLIPVNHLYGHIYANFIDDIASNNTQNSQSNSTKEIAFPAIGLIVSGGHTDVILIKNHGNITLLGGTRDDAAGECFDKCARLLGYTYPGGPKIADLAKKGNVKTFPLPRPMIGSHNFDFSFSGLKTAFLNETKRHFPTLSTNIIGTKSGWQHIVLENKLARKEKQILYDLCASLEYAIIDVLIKKTLKAALNHKAKSILLGGGVAANEKLRNTFKIRCDGQEITLFVPSTKLCTDNAAMIGAAAFFNYHPSPWKTVNADPELYFE